MSKFDELKRRAEFSLTSDGAFDTFRDEINPAEILNLLTIQAQLVEALANIAEPANAGCGCSFPCRCDSDGAEAINAGSMRSEAQEALAAYYAAAGAQP